MNYPGKELENFERAYIWRKYIYFLIKKYLKDNILEVGAGIGSFTKNYIKYFKSIQLTETDHNNYLKLKERFRDNDLLIENKFTNEINKKFNCIMYLNVLEHIKEDTNEINDALNLISSKGNLIILVPAHNSLYGKFDQAIGHHKRYEMDYFENLSLNNASIKKLIFLDSMGYFLYYLNKIFFKEEVYPSKTKVFIWDKIFTPISIILDKLSNYKFGKSILCIIEKN
jgi:hypothetical protein|tara:strand:+ start:1151 stop:1831 length:681 start_codon:yes stop_codon:yes gene_type:complete